MSEYQHLSSTRLIGRLVPPGEKAMANPVERLTSEWQLAPAAALSDLPYTGMAVMRWTCRTALKREFVSRLGDDVHVFSMCCATRARAHGWMDGSFGTA
jgi:hypothetical protein